MRSCNILQGKRNPFSCSRRVFSATLLGLSLSFSPANPAVGEDGAREEIAGRVTRAGEGAGGVVVEVHLEARGGGGRTPAAATVSGEDGSFLLSLPPGEYHLAAKLASPGPGPPVVVEHPESPISITSGDIKEIASLDLSQAEERLSPSSGVRGGILFGEEAVPGRLSCSMTQGLPSLWAPAISAGLKAVPEGASRPPRLPGTTW